VLLITVRLYPEFRWVDRLHGIVEPFYLWVEDSENEKIYHSEYVLLHKKQAISGEPLVLQFNIPVFEPLPPQYWIRVLSDRWLGLETVQPVSFDGLTLPERQPPNTSLLPLSPLPLSALRNTRFESVYEGKFTHFNPVQTQSAFFQRRALTSNRSVLNSTPAVSLRCMEPITTCYLVPRLARARRLRQSSPSSAFLAPTGARKLCILLPSKLWLQNALGTGNANSEVVWGQQSLN